MLRNYTERLAAMLSDTQSRKFVEDVVQDVAAVEVSRKPIKGRRMSDLLDFLERADPVTRGTSTVEELADVYVDRTFHRWLDIAEPSEAAAREQVSGVVEGLAGALQAVKSAGGLRGFNDQANKAFVRALMSGAAVRPLTEALTPQEARESGAQMLTESPDASGAQLGRFLQASGSGAGLSRISPESAKRAAKASWGIWKSIGRLAKSQMGIAAPDFASPDRITRRAKTVSVNVDRAPGERLAGELNKKGRALAGKARSPEGKTVRRLILLGDALGVWSSNVLSSPAVRDRDNNLAGVFTSNLGAGRLFPAGTPYANAAAVRRVTEKLLDQERSGRVVGSSSYRKLKAANTYRVVWLAPQARAAPSAMVDTAAEEKQDVPRTASDRPQMRRGRTAGISEDPRGGKKQKVEPAEKGRPAGISESAAPPNRLRVATYETTATATNHSTMPKSGPILRTVVASNAVSVLRANQTLRSTGIAQSNVVDVTAARMQERLVRGSDKEDVEALIQLRSSCVQQANTKSLAALARAKTQLSEMTSRADTLQATLRSERVIATRQKTQLDDDMSALKANNEDLGTKYSTLTLQFGQVQREYQAHTEQWVTARAKHSATVAQLRQAEHAKMAVQKSAAQADNVFRNKLEALERRLAAGVGTNKEAAERARASAERDLANVHREWEGKISDTERVVRDLESQLAREKDENAEVWGRNEKLMADQEEVRRELDHCNYDARNMQEQIEQLGQEKRSNDRNMRDLAGQVKKMESIVMQMGTRAAQAELQGRASGAEAQVAVAQFKRYAAANEELNFVVQDMKQRLTAMEEEVVAGHSQCPITRPEDIEMRVASEMGGREGGGFQGEGGAFMRTHPDMFEGSDVTHDYGDFDPLPPFSEEVEVSEPSNGALIGLGLLLLIVLLYVAYR